MLEFRPTCGHCNKKLTPESLDTMHCSFECTFCAACAQNLFGNICPKFGGGFSPRPIRPARNWQGDNFLRKYPASAAVKRRPVNLGAHKELAATVGSLRPEKR